MAGRIPQHFIDQLINRIDIVDLIDSYVPLKKAGANYKACCPFHGEKTPSFTVSPSKQFYHCFGCGANGTAISWLMDYEHMEFREAIEKLASSAGLDIPEEAQGYEKKQTVSQGIDLYELMNRVNEFYQTQLRQHKDKQQAIDYLKNRGLSGEIAKRFELGFAAEGWDNLMSALGASDPEKKALLETGMLSQNDSDRIYDRFRHRIMFPIHDHRGRVVGFGGRVLDQGEPKYLNSPETPIFHKGSELYGLFAARGSIKEADGILVVEGYMDVVALAQAGINNAVATLGTATTPMHLQRLFRHSTNITFSFDGDRAGRAAAWKALETCLPLLQDGFQISFLFLPDGEDPDTMVSKVGKEEFEKLVAQATPLPDFLIDSLTKQSDLSRLDGRAKLANLAKPLLKQFPDGLLRKLVIERLARVTQVNPQDLLDNSANSRPNSNSSRNTYQNKLQRSGSKAMTDRQPMTPVRRAISLLMQQPKLANEIPSDIELNNKKIRGIELLSELITICSENHSISTAGLLERYRQEAHFSALEKLTSHDHLLTEDQITPAFLGLLRQLQQQSADAKLEQLLEKSKHESLSEQEKTLLMDLLAKKPSN
ncbi:MAG: DNA primase [Acidiferrobacterales bacterium]|nr:DNA primase [Acidiferrobacterales bacterium]